VVVAAVINIPRTLLCRRPLLSRTAQLDRILRERGALSLGILRRTSSRLGRLVELTAMATTASWVYCHGAQIGSGAMHFRAIVVSLVRVTW
jgi:hypothetical protein